jgi:very-short-patch-repair endonuclease
VAAEMVAMAPGPVQLNIFAWNQKLTKNTRKYVWKLTKYELIFWNMVSSHHSRGFKFYSLSTVVGLICRFL